MAELARGDRGGFSPVVQLSVSAPDLVGRDSELAALVRTVSCAPALAVVEGEAGIGKSGLVRELLAAVAERRRLVGRCHRIRDPFPLGAAVDALRGLARTRPTPRPTPVAGALMPLLPELEWLPPAPAPLDDPRAERHRLFRAVLELIEALGPTVLVLEDLHWADPATLELLDFLACQLPSGLSLVLTYRREELGPGSLLLGLPARAAGTAQTETVALRWLDRVHVAAMVSSMLGGEPAAPELVELLHERTAGSPFAVEQLVRWLVDCDRLIPSDRGWTMRQPVRLEVPSAVRDAVLERIGLLRADARRMIETAAVLELATDESLLGLATGLTPARASSAICEALGTGVLRVGADGKYALCHTLAAQAIREAIPLPRRRRLHLRVAHTAKSAGGIPAVRLAHHYKEARRPRLWLRYAEEAADGLAAVGADREAAALLRDALSAPELPNSARIRMAAKLADASIYARDPTPAIMVLEPLIAHRPVSRAVRGQLRFSLGRLLIEVGEPARARRQLTAAAEDLRHVPDQRARALAMVGEAGEGRASVHDRPVGTRSRDPVLTTAILGSRAAALLRAGDPSGWPAVEQLPKRAQSRSHGVELVRCYKHLADAACQLGHCRAAQRFLDCAEAMRDELGHQRFGVGLATVRARLDWRIGNWEGLYARARALVDASPDSPVWAAAGEVIAALLLLSRGDLDGAEPSFVRGLEVFRGTDHSQAASAASGLSAIQLARGKPDAALETLAPVLEAVDDCGCWQLAYAILPYAVEALSARGEPREARALLRRMSAGLGGLDAPAATATLSVCRGMVADAAGHPATAARHYCYAERSWRAVRAPYEAARASERRGQARLAAQDRRGADDLMMALREHERLGARWDAARVRRALRRHDVTLPYPWRGGPHGYGSALSPRELEVARLAGSGYTNREIAEALFLSPRTIDRHVASAMRKLRIGSRRELGDKGRTPSLAARTS